MGFDTRFQLVDVRETADLIAAAAAGRALPTVAQLTATEWASVVAAVSARARG